MQVVKFRPIVAAGYSLDWIKIQTTRACNFSCKFCSQADWASKESLDFELLKKNVLDLIPGIRLLIITGGEPLAKPELLQTIASCVSKNGTEVGVFSNLSLLNNRKCKMLLDSGVSWWRTTLNGHNAEIHEKSYPNGAFTKTLNGIEIALSMNSTVKVRSTISKGNIDHIPDLVEYCISLGIKEIDFRPYLPLGDCNPHNEHQLSTNETLFAAAMLINLEKVHSEKIKIKLLPNWFDFVYRDISGSSQPCEKCYCGRQYIYVDAVGNYRSCAGHRSVAGNIKDINIVDIWTNNDMIKTTRSYGHDDYCARCAYKTQCMESNCHLVNYEAHGTFDKVNPTCPIWKCDNNSPIEGSKIVRSQFKEHFDNVSR